MSLVKPEDIQAHKKIKKKKKQSKKNTYEKKLKSAGLQKHIAEKIDNCTNIPNELKRQFKSIEMNPLALIIDDIPSGVSNIEFCEFFNSLLSSMIEKYKKDKVDPVKSF